MPPAVDVLRNATTLANEWVLAAVFWHAVIVAFLYAAFSRWRWPGGTDAVIAALCASVAWLAGLTGNWFTAYVFLALTIVSGLHAAGVRERLQLTPSARWAAPGVWLVLFGLAYPHFVQVPHWVAYLYAAPVGIVPCPTLLVAIGLKIVLPDERGPLASISLTLAGLFYGIVGVWVLGVSIDVVLIAGAIALGILTVSSGERRMPQQHESIFPPSSVRSA